MQPSSSRKTRTPEAPVFLGLWQESFVRRTILRSFLWLPKCCKEGMTMKIKRDDTVIVISGDDKGTKGKVIATFPEENKVIVSGVHVVNKHTKARKEGDQAGIIKVEGAIYADKVLLYCDNCKKGVRTAYSIENGKKTRVCAKCRKKI